ncbi:MAG: hypothetical protein EAZ70_01015 [Runella slithyformis]|nr:MAG: hypothetical protein EAY79_08585 [Runella slithyformis]TAF96903.1 MAG: hypothetical protein EAZ46_03775 [Runella sp.]TAG21346.1 MAG: hypothetical protein EAZ38_08350 [Cytophagales bacterium]TAG40696.1 MAG: hypothetical protein EAZ32_05700 [Cytophagia bacterium]TAE92671.1 MAG: hypothetical protein EAZ80_12030 [Runella slithyformis]
MKNLLLLLAVVWSISACQKTEIEAAPTSSTGAPVNLSNPAQTFDVAGQKLIAQGTFMGSGRYSASGVVKRYEKGAKQTLVFEDFKIDSGPDLRIYLAEDKSAKGFVELSSKVNSGNFFLELPANTDLAKQKQVLIWCKQFTVLFGNAELK